MNRSFINGANILVRGVKKNARPLALIGQLAGLAATAIATWNARPKVDAILESTREQRHSDDKKERLDANLQTAKQVAVAMIPTATAIATSAAGGLIGYHVASVQIGEAVTMANNAMSMANLATKEKMELEDAMRKTLGEEQVKEVEEKREEINAKTEAGYSNLANVIVKPGDVLCKDYYSGQFFSGNRAKFDLVERYIYDDLTEGDFGIRNSMRDGFNSENNYDEYDDTSVLINDIYLRIGGGLEPNGFGEGYGFSRNKLRKFNHGDTVKIITTGDQTADGVPYLLVSFSPAPWKVDV